MRLDGFWEGNFPRDIDEFSPTPSPKSISQSTALLRDCSSKTLLAPESSPYPGLAQKRNKEMKQAELPLVRWLLMGVG